jgi:hypothetical protein
VGSNQELHPQASLALTPTEIADRAVNLRKLARRIPDPSMSNYKKVLNDYKELVDEILELMWHLASHTHVVVAEIAPEEKK